MFVEMVVVPTLNLTVAHTDDECGGRIAIACEHSKDGLRFTAECSQTGCDPLIVSFSQPTDHE